MRWRRCACGSSPTGSTEQPLKAVRRVRTADGKVLRPRFFYRRALADRTDKAVTVVYAVFPTDGKPDPVPVLAGFPAGWRPTDSPGQCLADPLSTGGYFLTTVPRSQFRHDQRIDEAEALALYPDLLN